jgi:CubicO group peptidase (beta-lactamase class C family)
LTVVSDSDLLAGVVGAVLHGGIPGAHLSARTPDRRWESCQGLAQAFGDDGPLTRPLTPETAHDLGSVTKIAGTTAMLIALASEGALSPDDPVIRYLPGLSDAVGSDARLADLLTHRAGLWEWWPTYLMPDDPLEVVRRLPLRYPPRTARHYSDLGFMILGRIVEVVTGMGLAEAHARYVLGAIGTDGLSYRAGPAGVPVAASSRGDAIEYRMVVTGEPYPVATQDVGMPVRPDDFPRWRTRVLVGEVNDGNAFHAFGGAAGHAGLFGTADALHALGGYLAEALAGGNGWSAAARFAEPGPDPVQALGFRRWASEAAGCSADVLGHTGFPGTGFGLIPAHRLSVVFLSNRLHVVGETIGTESFWQAGVEAAHRSFHRDA